MVKRHYDNSELMNYKEREPNLESFEGKELLLHFDSFCLGDTICFSSLMDAFMDYHKPKYVWVTTFFPHLLKSNRSDYEFINANESGFLEIDKLALAQSKAERDYQAKMMDVQSKNQLASQKLEIEREKLKIARENQANDLAVAKENAKGRAKKTK
jgi:hypothetical protein